ncbi:iron ABC transporter substrate-binding protein [Sporosarcina sp. P12(2017)]|uniref:helical backbone metal receptor n=1 Tax=unclassified Sporosarcina TaxID=2647733 RepID=UPI000C173ACE|nr:MULTISPECIES: helical backbone metal receptor [unclassified Sporosarcina]PIC56514.1 iron ABC transporter substrate-binding protein [Sporosarcina sp. P10]PIC60165.1 iron ABC transporter substrate-binding protein [Sporosarcina sp. P12(2017)]
MKKEIIDHLGRTVVYNFPPKRIVTLCPGITETLFGIGLEKEIVGRTRYCIYPEQAKNVPAVAGTKDLKLEKIHEVQPDLIIMEKEENTKEMVEILAEFYPVYVAEVQTIGEAYRMITDMGTLTDHEQQSESLVTEIKQAFTELPTLPAARVAYVIWQKPYMVAGKDTYINSLLQKLGFITPFVESSDRYPALTEEQFKEANLDLVLLSSEPYPFKEKQQIQFQEMLPDSAIQLIDGEMFWYGVRMLEGAKYFKDFSFDV